MAEIYRSITHASWSSGSAVGCGPALASWARQVDIRFAAPRYRTTTITITSRAEIRLSHTSTRHLLIGARSHRMRRLPDWLVSVHAQRGRLGAPRATGRWSALGHRRVGGPACVIGTICIAWRMEPVPTLRSRRTRSCTPRQFRCDYSVGHRCFVGTWPVARMDLVCSKVCRSTRTLETQSPTCEFGNHLCDSSRPRRRPWPKLEPFIMRLLDELRDTYDAERNSSPRRWPKWRRRQPHLT